MRRSTRNGFKLIIKSTAPTDAGIPALVLITDIYSLVISLISNANFVTLTAEWAKMQNGLKCRIG